MGEKERPREEIMEGSIRPNRSDVHLSAEEAAKMEEATRDYFDGVAPKRHTKPQRSDYAETYIDAFTDEQDNNSKEAPEFAEFRRLENDSQKLVHNGNQVEEEFVETEYYKDLGCVDKQHHTTGTGFIKVETMKGKSFGLAPDAVSHCHASCKGNPATNEWIPAPADAANFISEKPNRSDI